MGKHDLKAFKLQVNTILSKLVAFISVGTPLRYTGDFDLSDPKSLITRETLTDMVGTHTLIAPWDGGPVDINQYRSHLIEGVAFLFRSTVDDNVSEPVKPGTLGAWTRTDALYIPPAWNIGTNYPLDAYVADGGNVYKSKTAGNIGHDPSADLDEEFWELIGVNQGYYAAGPAYGLGDVVIDDEDGNRIYISNIADNDNPLSDNGSSTWQVIGVFFNDATISSITGWSSEQITNYVDTHTSPPTQLIGFDWDVTPENSVDMTVGDRFKFGNNPRIEVWLIIDGNTEERYDAGRCHKIKAAGVLQTISFPDMDLEFSDTKSGYFLIST